MLCRWLAGILRSTILSALAPHRLALGPGSVSLSSLSSLSPMTQQSIAAAQAAVAAAADSAAAAGEQLTPAAAAAIVAGYDEVPFMAKTASMQVQALNNTHTQKTDQFPWHGPSYRQHFLSTSWLHAADVKFCLSQLQMLPVPLSAVMRGNLTLKCCCCCRCCCFSNCNLLPPCCVFAGAVITCGRPDWCRPA